jgi:mannose-6-phosphate isomerase
MVATVKIPPENRPKPAEAEAVGRKSVYNASHIGGDRLRSGETMSVLGPVILEPVLKSTVWGGRRLESLFRLPLPPGEKVGEAWVVADHPHGQSRVAGGLLAGMTLRQLVESRSEAIYGSGFPAGWLHRFPLLVKLIDAAADLSVQVHPDVHAVRRLSVADSPKAECWVVLQAEPEARLILGIRPGTHPEAFLQAALDGRLESMLVERPVQAGEVVFVPAGCVHAIGRGIVLAEFQQPSDTTYRVYDWGRGRELHLTQAMASLDFERNETLCRGSILRQEAGLTVESLVACAEFYVHRATSDGSAIARRLDLGFECAMIISGEADVAWPMQREPLSIRTGQTLLVPAACGSYELRPRGVVTALMSGVPQPR